MLDKPKRTAIDLAIKNKHSNIAQHLKSTIFERQEQTQAKFFNASRSKNPATGALVKRYRDFVLIQEKDSTTIYADFVPGRRLITGDAGAISESLAPLNLS